LPPDSAESKGLKSRTTLASMKYAVQAMREGLHTADGRIDLGEQITDVIR
jgi:hypothetical protein